MGVALGFDGLIFYKTVLTHTPISSNGFFAANRLTTTSVKFYEAAGTPTITNTFAETTPAVPTTLICSGARGLTGDATADMYANTNELCLIHGLTITDAQVLLARNIITQLQTDFGRA